jgi:hypothetical protein
MVPHMPSIEELALSIESVVIEAHVFLRRGRTIYEAADAASSSAGYRCINSNWRVVDPQIIPKILSYRIGHDLAYSTDELLPIADCDDLAARLVSHADSNSVWVTNHHITDVWSSCKDSYSWTPVSDWTFDMAIVAVGASHTLFICFLAED